MRGKAVVAAVLPKLWEIERSSDYDSVAVAEAVAWLSSQPKIYRGGQICNSNCILHQDSGIFQQTSCSNVEPETMRNKKVKIYVAGMS